MKTSSNNDYLKKLHFIEIDDLKTKIKKMKLTRDNKIITFQKNSTA